MGTNRYALPELRVQERDEQRICENRSPLLMLVTDRLVILCLTPPFDQNDSQTLHPLSR